MRIGIPLGVVPLLVLGIGACSSQPSPAGSSSAAAIDDFPGCEGLYNTQPSPSGDYFATDFGCSSNPYFTDPGDECGSADCIQSGYDQGVCSSDQSDADCQRTVNWYSIGGARYGCGARLEVTNPANGKSVVVMVLDNGPSCTVENNAGFWVLDVSYPTIQYLFGQEEGYSDHALVHAVVVDGSTPLGPTDGTQSSPGGGGGGDDAGPASSDDAGPPASSDDSGPSGGGTACHTDGDCNTGSDGSGQICVGGTCVPGCNADWECPGNTTCKSGQCQ